MSQSANRQTHSLTLECDSATTHLFTHARLFAFRSIYWIFHLVSSYNNDINSNPHLGKSSMVCLSYIHIWQMASFSKLNGQCVNLMRHWIGNTRTAYLYFYFMQTLVRWQLCKKSPAQSFLFLSILFRRLFGLSLPSSSFRSLYCATPRHFIRNLPLRCISLVFFFLLFLVDCVDSARLFVNTHKTSLLNVLWHFSTKELCVHTERNNNNDAPEPHSHTATTQRKEKSKIKLKPMAIAHLIDYIGIAFRISSRNCICACAWAWVSACVCVM